MLLSDVRLRLRVCQKEQVWGDPELCRDAADAIDILLQMLEEEQVKNANLNTEVTVLRVLSEKNSGLVGRFTDQALELDTVKAQRDMLLQVVMSEGVCCDVCGHMDKHPDCTGDCENCEKDCACRACDETNNGFALKDVPGVE